MAINPQPNKAATVILDAVRRAARQEQFLDVVSPEEAHRRFAACVDRSPLGAETLPLSAILGRVLAADVIAPVDAPPFDRSNVDGFAVRAADTLGASDGAPKRLSLNAEVIACGVEPALEVTPGTATALATGGVIPRGADAVVMIEHTELVEDDAAPAIDLRRAAASGQFISYAGSDIARGETLLRKGAPIGSREIGMLAACGYAAIDVVRRPRVAVLSTGDELVEPGRPLRPGGVYDSNGAIIAAAVVEAGGEPVPFGAFPDEEVALEIAMRTALDSCDMVVLSGGTSKGAGDLSHRIVSRLGKPGILVHGVALKPGKPLCLAAIGDKPLIVLPGFPTSAIFTFHAFAAPLIRARAGRSAEAAKTVTARVPVRIASELGREEFVLVSLVAGADGLIAFPNGKGSGAVTAFSQADGFLAIDALASALDADTEAEVTLIGGQAHAPDLVIMGSHDIALDVVVGALLDRGFHSRTIAVGSLGGVAAASRGECDVAPVHLVDPATGIYNKHLVAPGLTLVPGWRRMQGFVFRPGDVRFEGRSADAALKAALADPAVLMVNRNAGSGTRVLVDELLARFQAEWAPVSRPESTPTQKFARPAGYANQPRSHNAVAAAIARHSADWGIAIEPVARMYGLGFLPVAPEHYDFLLIEARRDRPAVQAFLEVLHDETTRARIRALGMEPAGA
jgi:putative molybdopterin biosynthesis protein